MTDAVQLDPTAPLSNSSTATPTSGTPSEIRVSMTDPRVWARGKTLDEVLAGAEQVSSNYQQLAGVVQQLAVDPRLNQPYQQQQPSQGGNWNDVKDDDVVDGKTFKQGLQAMAGMAPQQDQGQMAQMAWQMVANEPQRARLFQKYGPEIQAEVVSLPVHMRTLAYIRQVADIVASRHLDELATERAREIATTMTGLPIRSDGMGSPAALESDGLPTNYQEILSKDGVDLAMVRGFCASQSPPWSLKKWFDNKPGMRAVGSNR